MVIFPSPWQLNCARANCCAMHDFLSSRFKYYSKGHMDTDTMKLKGGSNERPCHFVKRLEVIGKFAVTHKL